jgi:hypothetical protein
MDENLRNACGMRRVCKRNHVRVMAVHTAVRDQPKQMQPMAARFGKRFPQSSITRKFAFFDCLINSRQILVNDPPRSQV